jgi:hypothetical protein
MKILRRWAGLRPEWAALLRANRGAGRTAADISKGRQPQSSNRELTRRPYRVQRTENLTAKQDDRGRGRTEPVAAGVLELDQDQAKVVLAALEDAAVPDPGQIRHSDTPEPSEHVPATEPDTSQYVPPEVYNCMGDDAHQVNHPGYDLYGQPYTSAKRQALLAESPADAQADRGSGDQRIASESAAGDHQGKARNYQPDREAGE